MTERKTLLTLARRIVGVRETKTVVSVRGGAGKEGLTINRRRPDQVRVRNLESRRLHHRRAPAAVERERVASEKA